MAKRRRGRRRTTLITSVVVLALIIAAWMGYRAHATENADDYVTATVSKGDVDQYLDLSGTVSETKQSSVGFPASGTVTSVNVALGDHVTAGEKLATMDDSQLKLAVIQAKADLASAKDEVTQAEQAADGSGDSSTSIGAGATSSSAAASASPSGSAGSQGSGSAGTGGSAYQGSGGTGTADTTGGGGKTGAGTGSTGNTNTSGTGNTNTNGTGNAGGARAQSQLKPLQDKVNRETAELATLEAQETSAINNLDDVCQDYGVSETPPPSPSSPTSPSDPASPSNPASPSSPTSSASSPSSTPTEPSASPTESAPTSASPTESATTSAPATSSATPSPTNSATDSAAPSSATPTDDASDPTASNADYVIGSGGIESVDSPADSAQQLQACVAAMGQVQTAQQGVSDQQTKIQQATGALTDALQAAAQASAGTGGTAGSHPTSKSSTPADSQPSSNATTSQSGDQQNSYQCTLGQGSASTPGSSSTSASGGRSADSSGGKLAGASEGQGESTTGATTSQSSGSGSSSRSTGSAGSSGSATNLSGGQGSTTTVAEAKAAVTTAKINLKLAEQKLSDATITSPIAGTVASLGFAKGDSVSTSDKIVITGQGAMAVTVDVPGTKLDSIKKGQQATVGTNNSVGEVSSIGLLPTSDSSSSDVSYPVTITVADPAADLADGATAMAHLLTSRVTNVVQVPVSTVTRNGSTGIVTVLKDNKPQRTQVTIGAVGSTTVQITSGLSVGETVVIADRSQPLPSSDSATNRFGGVGIGGQRIVRTGEGPAASGTGRR